VTLSTTEQRRLMVVNHLGFPGHGASDPGGSGHRVPAAPSLATAPPATRPLPSRGMLLQIDGSRHDWLEGRGLVE